MRTLKFYSAAALLSVAPITAAHASEQVISFDQGNYCNGGELCANNAAIDAGYGSTNQVTVGMGGLYDGYPTGPMFYYERGFGDLVGVAYGNKGSVDFRTSSRITISALSGFEVRLKSFDLGCFGGAANCQSANYSVQPGGGPLVRGSISTGYPGHSTVTFGTGYGNVIDLFFGSGENVGIDNITYDVRPIVAAGVPEPATWAMMILGFGMVGGAMRRRKSRAALSYA
jgi:hypothetical protein